MEIEQTSNIADGFDDGLEKLIAVETDARAFGFECDNTNRILAQAISECEEVHEAIVNNESANHLQEEMGDFCTWLFPYALSRGLTRNKPYQRMLISLICACRH